MQKNSQKQNGYIPHHFFGKKSGGGYITLIIVTIVGAFTAAMTLGVLADGISSSSTGLSFSQTYKARSYTNACAEKALFRIHNGDITISEDITASPIIFDNGNCIYIANISGGNITINASGISGRAIVNITVTGTVAGGLVTITGWQ